MNKITVYICNDNKKGIINPLLELKPDFKNSLEIVGSGLQDDNSFKEICLSRVDVAITGLLTSEQCRTLAKMSPSTQLLMLTSDSNRAKAVVNDMNKEQIYSVNFLDLSAISPRNVFEFVSENYNKNALDTELKTEKLEDIKLDTVPLEKVGEADDAKKEETVSENLENALQSKDLDFKEKINLLNLKSKTISLYSRKGGTGKTTIASELAHLYGNVILPSKLGYDSKYLKTVLLDLDFEEGNVRSKLGVENPLPNNYLWIEDIVKRIENKEDIDDITYTSAQVMSQFTKKINGEFYVAINDQGGIPYRIVDLINQNDTDGKLFQKIIKIIINSLKKAFDIVIIDLPSEFKEECLVACQMSDLVVYVTNPTIMDMENFKVFLDEVKEYSVLDFSKVVLVDNKEVKSGRIMELFDMIQKEIRYTTYSYDLNKTVELNVPVVAHLPWTTDCLVAESTYSFVTDRGSSLFKKELLKLAEYILPIFKIKTNHDVKKYNKAQSVKKSTVLSNVGLKDASQVAKTKEDEDEAKRKELEERKKKKKEKKNKKGKVEDTAKETSQNIDTKTTLKQNENIKGATIIDAGADSTNASLDTKLDTSKKNDVKKKKLGLLSLFRKKEETLPEFVARLIELSKNPKNRIRLDENGFPHCLVKPKKTSSKVWNEYRKKLAEVNKALKDEKENQSNLASK